MRKGKQEPFMPYVTMDELMEFDAAREETYTKSRLMNAVMKAMQVEKLHSARAIGHYLNLPPAKLTGAIEIITGMRLNDIREEWVTLLLQRLEREHPDWNNDQLAHEMGYSDRSVLWNLNHRDAHYRYYKEFYDRRRAFWGNY